MIYLVCDKQIPDNLMVIVVSYNYSLVNITLIHGITYKYEKPLISQLLAGSHIKCHVKYLFSL